MIPDRDGITSNMTDKPSTSSPATTRRNVIVGVGAATAGAVVPSVNTKAESPQTDSVTDVDYGELAQIDLTGIENRVEELVTESLDEYEIPGATVAVVRDGEISMTRGYGVADRETGDSVEPTTPFRVGSVSKPVVWTAIARLAGDSEVDLETPVSEYLEDDLVSWEDPVTLANLATHTGGFESTNRGMWYADPADVQSLQSHLAPMPAQVRAPSTLGSYSNHGAALAGQVLASVAGDRFPAVMEDELLGPTGMETSSFRQPLSDELYSAHATGHDGGLDAKFAGLGISPAGALSASAADMAKFMQLHVNSGIIDGEQVLDAEVIDLIQRQWFTHHETLAGTALGFVERHDADIRAIGHNGGTPTFHSNLILVPEVGFGLFISFNSANATAPRESIPETILEEYFSGDDTVVPEPTGSPTHADELPGTYRSLKVGETTHDSLVTTLQAPTTEIRIAEDGALLTGDEDDPSRWVEIEPMLFQNEDTGRKIAFGTTDGSVTHLFISGSVTAQERIEWNESTPAHLLFLGVSLVGLASGHTYWSPSRENGETRREWVVSLREDREKMSKAFVYAGSTAFLAFIVVTMLYLSFDTFGFLSDPSVHYRALFILPSLGAVTGIISVGLAVDRWRSDDWSSVNRIHYALVAGALVAMTAFLRHWNLLLPR
ncbi:class A beta-lactamase-related serine hydrolase [Halorubrum sp. GN12_10-3_MGM]|nr:class A beta-lactamase-related serine hydrolase [Halorubrum sp. GN12_10-3_MGM]